jgi:membrane protein DedA with SNARE-associated domain
MQPFRFSLFVVLGTLPFAIGMALLGYAFGDEVIKYLRTIAYVVALILVALAAWWLVRRRRARGARPDEPLEPAEPAGRFETNP